MPAVQRKPRTRPKKRAKPASKTQRAKTRTLARVLVDIHKRLDRLEHKDRTVTGFACAEASVPAEPYRTLEEIAESDDGPFI